MLTNISFYAPKVPPNLYLLIVGNYLLKDKGVCVAPKDAELWGSEFSPFIGHGGETENHWTLVLNTASIGKCHRKKFTRKKYKL
jgi:hypothetical protein